MEVSGILGKGKLVYWVYDYICEENECFKMMKLYVYSNWKQV